MVETPFPTLINRRLEHRLVELLKPMFQPLAYVLMEYPFRVGDHDLRSADQFALKLYF